MSTPWDNEPDSDSFEASELVCVMKRDHNGVWNGYVGLSKLHPLHGQRRDVRVLVPQRDGGRELNEKRLAIADVGGRMPRALEAGSAVPLSILIDVHGGLWSTGAIDGDHPGLWFFGFTCGHPWDFKPLDPLTVQGYQTMDPETAEMLYRTPAEYRTYEYARGETESLAAQLAALADASIATETT